MNAQYPTAISTELPVGNKAKLISVKNIDDCFGIIYA
jgi:hypothetical protein